MKYSITLDNQSTKTIYFVIIGAAYYEISLSKSQIINRVIGSNYKSKEATFNIGSKLYSFSELACKGEEVLDGKIERFLNDDLAAYKILVKKEGEFIDAKDNEDKCRKIMESLLKEFIITGMNKFDFDCFISTFFPTDSDEREFRDEEYGNLCSYFFSKRVMEGNELQEKLIKRYKYIESKYKFYSVIVNSFYDTKMIRAFNDYENIENLKEDIKKAKNKLLEFDNIKNIKNKVCQYKSKPYEINYYCIISEIDKLEKVQDVQEIELFETTIEMIIKNSIEKVARIFLKNNYLLMTFFKVDTILYGIERCYCEDDKLINKIIDNHKKVNGSTKK